MSYTRGEGSFLPYFLRDINTGLPLAKDGVLTGAERGIFHEGGIMGEGSEGWTTRREFKFEGDEWAIGMVDDDRNYRYRLARSRDGLVMVTGYTPFFNLIYENDGDGIVGCNFSLSDLIRRTVGTYGENEKIITGKCLDTINKYDQTGADLRFRTFPVGPEEVGWELLVELGKKNEVLIGNGELKQIDSSQAWLVNLQEFDLMACYEYGVDSGMRIGVISMDRSLYVGLNFSHLVDFSEAKWLASKDYRRPTYRSELQSVFRKISPIFCF